MLRIGIVGAGLRGRMYARALGFVEGVEVAAIADASDAVRAEAGQALGVPTYATHAEMYDRERLNAVIVATPDFAHRAPAVDAARAGLHLMIEKPLATTVEDAQAVQQAVGEAGVECMVAFENRWNPRSSECELLDSGQVGDVLSQTARLSNPYSVPVSMLSWAAHSSPGWFLLPHTLDLALWFSDKRPIKVYAAGFKRELRARGIDTWDAIHALLTFEDGTVASFESLWVLPDSVPSPVDFKYELIGTRSALYVDEQEQLVRSLADRFTFPGTLTPEVDGRPRGFPAWMVESFARRLLAGEPLSPGVEQGLLVTRIAAAVHYSLETGEPCPL
ncbi:MAG: Gfo/Idh/MocA family oxidoreductase [Chloroflexia bacterium]